MLILDRCLKHQNAGMMGRISMPYLPVKIDKHTLIKQQSITLIEQSGSYLTRLYYQNREYISLGNILLLSSCSQFSFFLLHIKGEHTEHNHEHHRLSMAPYYAYNR